MSIKLLLAPKKQSKSVVMVKSNQPTHNLKFSSLSFKMKDNTLEVKL